MSDKEIDILIIDDDPDLGIMVSHVLKYAGYSIKYIPVADHVADVINATHPRLVLMDMLLSGVDGRDICRDLRNRDYTKDLNIIMMSANPDAGPSCIGAGANEFISKPFDIKPFLETVKHHLYTC
ncbi:MAG: response regulator [Chitinophagaceae bacterium]